jgi:SAM-dependent methyltransferase
VVNLISIYSTRPRIELIVDQVYKKDVLDLGCVEHDFSCANDPFWWLHNRIKLRANHVVGLDCDRDSVDRLVTDKWDIIWGNAECFDLRRTFDVVVAGELLEHLTNHRSCLESIKRHLRPGGKLVLSVPNSNSLNYFLQNLVFGHEVDSWDHTVSFTPLIITNLLRKCGFEMVSITLCQPNRIYHHGSFLRDTVSFISNKLQQLICLIRPSLARELVVVAQAIK